MIPSFAFTQNTLSRSLAMAAVTAQQDWQDTVLEVAQEALEFAKEQAPWFDRTGDAREGLDVDVDSPGDQIVLTMFHTVDYGEWLETIQNGRYSVIMPTLELFGPEIKRRIEGGG